MAIDVTSYGTPAEKLKWAFKMYDVDGNGVIEFDEMIHIIQVSFVFLIICAVYSKIDQSCNRLVNHCVGVFA
jgi:Ca2+-binding EF-hand superfamily protein